MGNLERLMDRENLQLFKLTGRGNKKSRDFAPDRRGMQVCLIQLPCPVPFRIRNLHIAFFIPDHCKMLPGGSSVARATRPPNLSQTATISGVG